MTKHTRKSQNARNDTRNIPRNTKSLIPRAPSLNVRKTGAMQESFSLPALQTASPSQHELTQHSPVLSQRLSRTLSGITRNSSISRTNYHNYHATPATLSHMAGLFSFSQFRLLRPHDYSLHAVSLLNAKSFRTPCGACAQSL